MLKNLIIGSLAAVLIAGGSYGYRLVDRLETATDTIQALQAGMTAMRLRHGRKLAQTKLRERGKRILTAVPIAGTAAAIWFEQQAYADWKQEHPDGSLEQYADEMSTVVGEILTEYGDDIGNGIPDYISAERVRTFIIDNLSG